MSWIKNVIIDMATTLVIAYFFFTQADWAWWVIAIYTPLMVLLKVFAFSGVATAVQRKADDVPVRFYHVLYGANMILLLISSFKFAAVGWAAIWVLSAVLESKGKPQNRN